MPLKIHDCILPFNATHAKSYNRLADLVQRNLLLTDWQDEHHKESLLNPANKDQALSTVENVLKSCCIAGHMYFRAGPSAMKQFQDDIDETLCILVEGGVVSSDTEKEELEHGMRHGCPCFKCNQYVQLPLVMPCCAGMVCASCASPHRTKCALCGRCFKMQSVADASRLENNLSPQWDVPVELIELQPAYEQTRWTGDWAHTTSTKVEF